MTEPNDAFEFNDGPALSDRDADALDALIDHGYDPAAVPEPMRDRARRVAALLGVLDTEPAFMTASPGPAAPSGAAADAGPGVPRAELSPDSADALDALVQSGFNPRRVTKGLREPARRHQTLREMVCTLDEDGERWVGEGRAERTREILGRVLDAETAPIPFEPAPKQRLRVGDLVGLAALFLIGTTLISPLVSTIRGTQAQTACFSNLADLASAFDSYANTHRGALPMAGDGFDGSWIRVGTPNQSNSANLFVLVRGRYASPETLACPGNEHAQTNPDLDSQRDWRSIEEVSYSYRLLPISGGQRWTLDGGSIVTADRSPITPAIVRGYTVGPEANSPNHDGLGQHLLTLDGSVRWTDSPVGSVPGSPGDNIWLPRRVEQRVRAERIRRGMISGHTSELPRAADDVFLGP